MEARKSLPRLPHSVSLTGMSGNQIKALLAMWVALVLLAAGAQAQSDDGLRPVEEGDDGWLWRPVGRLDMGDSTCTAALVTYRHVVTAAHCLYEKTAPELRDPGKVVFRAGLRDGRPYESLRGRRILLHPDYDPEDTDRARQIAADIALVELAGPIRDKSVKPFARHDRPHEGKTVTVVSYGTGRNETPAIQERCGLLDREGDVLVYDCAATFGSSGAPVFILSQSGPKLVSVLSAISSYEGQHVTVATALGEGYRTLIALVTTPEPEVKRVEPGGASLRDQLGRPGASGLPQITR